MYQLRPHVEGVVEFSFEAEILISDVIHTQKKYNFSWYSQKSYLACHLNDSIPELSPLQALELFF